MRNLQALLLSALLSIGAPPSAWASAERCATVFAAQTALNNFQSYQDIMVTSNVVFPGKNVHHVFQGDLRLTSVRRADGSFEKVPGIDGGLHTRGALERFLELRPDIRVLLNEHPEMRLFYPNGVVKVRFPEQAFADKQNMSGRPLVTRSGTFAIGTKSYFPPHWAHTKIIEAIRHTLVSGKIDAPGKTPRPGDGEVYRVVGIYENVRVLVVIRNSARPVIFSAYPSSDQGMAPLPPGQRQPLSIPGTMRFFLPQ